jgi:hypothetical protein
VHPDCSLLILLMTLHHDTMLINSLNSAISNPTTFPQPWNRWVVVVMIARPFTASMIWRCCCLCVVPSETLPMIGTITLTVQMWKTKIPSHGITTNLKQWRQQRKKRHGHRLSTPVARRAASKWIPKIDQQRGQQGHSWTTLMHLLLIILMKLVDQVKSNINDKTNGWVLPHSLLDGCHQPESPRSSVYRMEKQRNSERQ